MIFIESPAAGHHNVDLELRTHRIATNPGSRSLAVNLYLLNIGYQLVACLVAGGLLAIWKPRAAAAAPSQPA